MKKLLILLLFPLMMFSQSDYSISFNNSGSYVEVFDSPSLNIQQEFTISFWVKLNNFNGYSHFFNKWNYDDEDNRLIFACEPLGNDFGLYAWLGNNLVETSIQPALYEWQYLSLTYNSETCVVQFFVDGQLLESSNDDCYNLNDLVPTGYSINIGGNSTVTDGSNTIDGRMDNVEFWNTALSMEEIQQYMDCPPIGIEQGLVGFWKFNDGPDFTIVEDQTNYNNNGTANLTGGATYSQENCPELCSNNNNVNLEQETILIGDVDCSGEVNSQDAALILQYVTNVIDSLPCNEETIFLNSLSNNNLIYNCQIGEDIDGDQEGAKSGYSLDLNSTGDIVAIGSFDADNYDLGVSSIGSVSVYYNESGEWVQMGEKIWGQGFEDQFGISVSLNSAGNILAVGADRASMVAIYEFNGTSWNQIGENIYSLFNDNDYFGHSVSLSSNGDIIAIGAYNINEGYAGIYQNIANNWVQIGDNIIGESWGDDFGCSVSLSNNGQTLAVGARESGNDFGYVRLYDWDGVSWIQKGNDIFSLSDDKFGHSVSLSSNGDIVAIGAYLGDISGLVRIYSWNGDVWIQMGADIIGESMSTETEHCGYSVSLSDDGETIAIGSPQNNGELYNSTNMTGHVRIFQWDGNLWSQIGQDIDGEYLLNFSGWSVSLNSDGSKVAIGSYENDAGGNDAGHVRVFSIGGSCP